MSDNGKSGVITSAKRFAREYPELVEAYVAAMGERGWAVEDYTFKSATASYDPDDTPGTYFATFYPIWVDEERAKGNWGPLEYVWVTVQGVKGDSGPLSEIEVIFTGE